jgi:hypothetical protein
MWFHKKDKFPYKEGFIQAAEVVGYVILMTQFMTNGEKFFAHLNKSIGPIMFLTMFCFSVLACGLIVFYKPYLLFVDKKGKEAIQLVLATTKWLGAFALVVIAVVAMLSR